MQQTSQHNYIWCRSYWSLDLQDNKYNKKEISFFKCKKKTLFNSMDRLIVQ